MSKTDMQQAGKEFLDLMEEMTPGLSEKIIKDFKIVSVTIELAQPEDCRPLKIETNSVRARLLLEWFEDNSSGDR
jgi:hypothetical protein